ncbi:MAG TPA: TIM barrel protein [Bryobacteraceae bacterium]|nr:TIM barrel protein [Bryobacteraceae bacterium]
MLRRQFLQAAAAITGVSSIARSQMQANGIRLGFDSYSLRAFHWKAIPLIEYAAAQKLDAIQLSSLEDYESFEPAYLTSVREAAARLGITIDAGIGCICPSSKSWNAKHGKPDEYILKGLGVAKAIGASSMRCFLGAAADRLSPGGIDRHIENTIRILKPLRSRALDVGVKIAVENHSGDMQARELRTLIEQSGKDFVAACMDTGNPMWVVEDPLVTLEILGPYTVTTHIRDSVVFEHPRGAAAQWVALGDGVIDFKRFVARFRELCPRSTMQLENITGRPPQVLPYLEPEFWKAFPNAVASEFSRFVALAKSGHPFLGAMVIEDVAGKPPAEYTAALKAQQQYDLERGFEYARKTLGVGLRWRT